MLIEREEFRSRLPFLSFIHSLWLEYRFYVHLFTNGMLNWIHDVAACANKKNESTNDCGKSVER